MGDTWGLVLATGVLGILVWEETVLRTAWLALNLLDTLRALRTVRTNGRRIGIQTRKKAMREALACWIVYILGTSISPIISTFIGWVPLYAPVKAVVCLCFLFTRLASSTAILSTLGPLVKPYETPVDITLHLFESLFALVYHFGIELPFGKAWSCLGMLRQGGWSWGLQRAASWARTGWHLLQPSSIPAQPRQPAERLPTPPQSPLPRPPPSNPSAIPRKPSAQAKASVPKPTTRVRRPLEPIIITPSPSPPGPLPRHRPRRASLSLPSFPPVPTHPIIIVPSTPPQHPSNAVASRSRQPDQRPGLLGIVLDEPVRRSPRKNKGKKQADDDAYVPPPEEDGSNEAGRGTKRALGDTEEQGRAGALAVPPRAGRLGRPSKRLHPSQPDHPAPKPSTTHPAIPLASTAPKRSATSANLFDASTVAKSRPLPSSRSTAMLSTAASRARGEGAAAGTAGVGGASSRKGKGVERSAATSALPAASFKTTSRTTAVTSATVSSKKDAAEKKRQATGAGARARATVKRTKRDAAEDEGLDEEGSGGKKTGERVGEKRKAGSSRAVLEAREMGAVGTVRARKRTKMV
ncbi:hypothetical protein IAR50_006568 [Cryptococcus sp. DSM 104548]